MNGKQFVVATLFALVLLTLVFVPVAHQQSGGTYDPWLDYNEDGKIDVAELNPLGQAYGSSGDSTKNVTVVKHASETIKAAEDVIVTSENGWMSDFITIDGYAKATVLINIDTEMNDYRLSALESPTSRSYYVDQVVQFHFCLAKTYDVMSNQMLIEIYNLSQYPATLSVTIYLMA